MKKVCFVFAIIFLSFFSIAFCTNTVYAENNGLYKEGLYYYYVKDGKVVTNKFVKIDGYVHYFDNEGRMVTNKIQKINSDYYFFDKDGIRLSGWVELTNSYYDEIYRGMHYFNKDGKMIYDSFLKSGNSSYGFNIHGVQYINRFGMIKGKVYKFNEKGYKVDDFNLLTIESVKKYLNEGYEWLSLPSGECKLNWLVIEGGSPNVAYDYRIVAEIEPEDLRSDTHKTYSVMSKLIYSMHDEKFTKTDRDNANNTLQTYILSSIKVLKKLRPDAKIEACFNEVWYDHREKWRVYSNNRNSEYWLTCANFEQDFSAIGSNTYKKSKKTSLHWVSSNTTPCD